MSRKRILVTHAQTLLTTPRKGHKQHKRHQTMDVSDKNDEEILAIVKEECGGEVWIDDNRAKNYIAIVIDFGDGGVIMKGSNRDIVQKQGGKYLHYTNRAVIVGAKYGGKTPPVMYYIHQE
ncbi:hypothetical protein QBC44DRAFT_331275 [Cladorrhinum sp. PSN332]|nr:hypothetical protein QBC44DRAFT_331275 [Cladorrhinum sp. PSN332]